MSFVISDTSPVFSNPHSIAFLPSGKNINSVDATTGPVQLGGNSITYQTLPAPIGSTLQLVLSGINTRVNLSAGDAKVHAVGGGSVIESLNTDSVSPGKKIIDLGHPTAPFNQGTISRSLIVKGNQSGSLTINQASGGIAPQTQTAYYASGGSGNDMIQGSSLNDFIRGGEGDDTINAFGGNDLIRGGSGSDVIYGGAGSDTLYYSFDQLDESTDKFVDFQTGVDTIAFDKKLISSTSSLSGLGTNTITFTSTATKVISSGTVINSRDISFV